MPPRIVLGWVVLIGVVAVFALWALAKRSEGARFQRATFEGVVTHVEEENVRQPFVRALGPESGLRRFCVTYRTAAGDEDSFTFHIDEARRYAPHLLDLRPGDRIHKVPREEWPRAERTAKLPTFVADEIEWVQTGDPDEPYEAHVDGAKLTMRVSPFPGGAKYTVYIEGELDGELSEWPPGWSRTLGN